MTTNNEIWGSPVGVSEVNDLQQNFWWLYASINGNIRNEELQYNWDNLQEFLDIDSGWANTVGNGILLKHMIDQSNPMQPYFSYAIVLANMDIDGVVTPKLGARWFSITPAGTLMQYLTGTELAAMESYIGAYSSVLLRKMGDINTANSESVANVPNHPLQAFVDGRAVWQFFANNSINLDVNSLLVISNGACNPPVSALPPEPQDEYKAQSPVFYFKNNNTKWLSDTIENVGEPFYMKGMDHSHPCPPMCN